MFDPNKEGEKHSTTQGEHLMDLAMTVATLGLSELMRVDDDDDDE